MNYVAEPPAIAISDSVADAIAGYNNLVLGIDHVAVAVENIAEAMAWYVKALGFSVVEERVTKGETTSMLSAVLVSGAAVVVLIQGTSPRSQVSRFIQRFGPGVQHVAFNVGDLGAALARLAVSGAAMDTHVIEDIGIRQVFLRRDPGSGCRVELIERRGGKFSDRTVEQLFRKFEADDLY
jgi:methylmalonyl-CoA/ethylmalonyl-CoA epimerase